MDISHDPPMMVCINDNEEFPNCDKILLLLDTQTAHIVYAYHFIQLCNLFMYNIYMCGTPKPLLISIVICFDPSSSQIPPRAYYIFLQNP